MLIESLGGKPVEPQELLELLKLKANVEEVEEIQKNKTDKKQFFSATGIMATFHSQINHLCLILKDYLKTTNSMMEKEDQATKKKMGAFYKQVCTLAKWISKNEEQDLFVNPEISPREQNSSKIQNFLFNSTSSKPIHIRPLTSTSNRKSADLNIKYDPPQKITSSNLDLSILKPSHKKRLQSASSRRITPKPSPSPQPDLLKRPKESSKTVHNNSLLSSLRKKKNYSKLTVKEESIAPVNFTKIKAHRISQKGERVLKTNVKKFNQQRLSYTTKNTYRRYKSKPKRQVSLV